jgi:cysteine desulfurase / selenocysteine lyase
MAAAALKIQPLTHNAPYDVAKVRQDFPILARQVYGKPLVYLDNASSAQKPHSVVETMRQLYEEEYSNVHRGVHFLSGCATLRFENARDTVRRFINASSTKEIVFTRGATEAINLVAQTFGRTELKAGDAIVLSQLEHHANIVPWQLLAQERGLQLKVAPIDATGQLILEAYEKLLTPEVKLVAMSHMSNALGSILPAQDIVKLAHARGIPVLLDGCQAVTHLPVDVRTLDADFYVFSSHKLYGPTGIGVLYAKEDILNRLPPWQGGGDMIDTVTFEKTTYKAPPQRFEAGTPSIAEAIGFAAALDYISKLGITNIHAHETDLLQHASARLAALKGVSIHGTAKNKGAILSFTISGTHPQDIGMLIDQQGIAVRVGHHCCMPLMAHLGLPGTCRASFGLYNTFDEAEAFVLAVEKAVGLLA